MKIQAHKALELISKAQNILVTTHAKPDGDALGSLAAMTVFLDNLEKDYTALVDFVPEAFEYLPNSEYFVTEIENPDEFDLVITLDFNNLYRARHEDALQGLMDHGVPFINIDHHEGNAMFGQVNIVDTSSPSTTIILHRFFIHNDAHINADAATALLTGILTDTGNFSNTSTTPESINIASELLLAGAEFQKIQKNIREYKNIAVMKLWGELLERLTINTKYGIAYTILRDRDLEKYGVEYEELSGLPNFLAKMTGVKAIMVVKQNKDNIIRGSLRSIAEETDVAALARKIGGGGHRKAAGFSLNGKLKKHGKTWKIV
jgi:phosphoesterase RecJ-like protein